MAPRNGNVRDLFGGNSCSCLTFWIRVFVVCILSLSVTGFPHEAMHRQMGSEAQGERRKRDEAFGHA